MDQAFDQQYRDLRRDPRADVVLELEYRNEGHLLVSYCTNLSRGGLFVSCDDPLPPGTPITLSLRVPGYAQAFEALAEVRWVRSADDDGPGGMGVSFQSFDAVLGDHIDRIVADFQPMRIVIASNNVRTRGHVAALVRSLLTCDTQLRAVERELAEHVDHAHLVLVDLDHAEMEGLALLDALASQSAPPPWIVLCAAPTTASAQRAQRLGRLVATPVDVSALRQAMLETLAHVRGVRRGAGALL